MASPLAHGLVGLGCAAAVTNATGGQASPLLWAGAIIASGMPDLDFAVDLLGLAKTRFHRHATHSLLVLASSVLATVLLWGWLAGGIDGNLALAWSFALFSHPLLDAITTGPELAARGVGIPLFWPVTSRRWFLQRPVPTVDLIAPGSLRQVCGGLARENLLLGAIAVFLVISCYVF